MSSVKYLLPMKPITIDSEEIISMVNTEVISLYLIAIKSDGIMDIPRIIIAVKTILPMKLVFLPIFLAFNLIPRQHLSICMFAIPLYF